MAIVLRKNRAWLLQLIKENLPKIVPRLYKQEIIPQNAEQEDPCRIWNAIRREADKAEDTSEYGCKFIQVLINCKIGHVDDLKLVMEEFRDEQQRVIRIANSPDSVKKFAIPIPCEEPVCSDTLQLHEAGAHADDHANLTGQQFSIEESTIMGRFVHITCRATDLQPTEVREQYERLQRLYQRKEDTFAQQEETDELQSVSKHYKGCFEEEQQQHEQTKQKLEERTIQLADNEKKLFELQKEKESAEKELALAKEKVSSLEQKVNKKQLEIELFKSDQLLQSGISRDSRAVIRTKLDQWKEMQQLIDQLYQGRDLTHVRLAIVQKVNSIKTTSGRRRATID